MPSVSRKREFALPEAVVKQRRLVSTRPHLRQAAERRSEEVENVEAEEKRNVKMVENLRDDKAAGLDQSKLGGSRLMSFFKYIHRIKETVMKMKVI